MPTFDVQTSADAYGAQQYPYLVVVDAPIVGESFAVWPAGLFNAQTESNFVWSVGAHDQMIGGERQRIQTAGKWARMSARMNWSGADATTMRTWLLAVQSSAWVVNNPQIWGLPSVVRGYWADRVEVNTEPGTVWADIEAVISWQ